MKNILKWFLNVGLSGAVWYFADKIPWYSIFVGENWSWLLENRFSWWNAILFIIIFFVVVLVVSYLSKKIAQAKTDPIESSLKQFNNIEYSDINVLVTWDVYIGQLYDTDPHATNIQIFCKNHGDIPRRMIGGRCNFRGCSNGNQYISDDAVKNDIESRLLQMKRDLIKKYKR